MWDLHDIPENLKQTSLVELWFELVVSQLLRHQFPLHGVTVGWFETTAWIFRT